MNYVKNFKKAVALRYEKEQAQKAPKVVAVGEGLIADTIIRLAKKNDVPLYEDVEVVAKLVRVPLDTEIPSELYEAVAEILAFLYKLEEKSKKYIKEGTKY